MSILRFNCGCHQITRDIQKYARRRRNYNWPRAIGSLRLFLFLRERSLMDFSCEYCRPSVLTVEKYVQRLSRPYVIKLVSPAQPTSTDNDYLISFTNSVFMFTGLRVAIKTGLVIACVKVWRKEVWHVLSFERISFLTIVSCYFLCFFSTCVFFVSTNGLLILRLLNEWINKQMIVKDVA